VSAVTPPAWSPSPDEPLLRLRPLGLGEILDDIFRVYRRRFGLLVGIALILSVPGLLVQILAGQADQIGFIGTAFSNLGNPAAFAAQPPPQINLVGFGAGYLVVLVTIPFAVGGISQAAIDLALGNPVSVRSALLAVLRRYWGLLGLSLLYLLLSVTFICFPVFVWLFVRWSVAIPAQLAEGIGPVRALSRSWDLTRGSWWRIFGTLLVMYLLQSAVGGALGLLAYPIGLFVPFVPPVVHGAIVLTLGTASQALVLPVLYLCVVLIYFDLRIRREHFDLDQLARQAAGS
jgi:hypothetical protein